MQASYPSYFSKASVAYALRLLALTMACGCHCENNSDSSTPRRMTVAPALSISTDTSNSKSVNAIPSDTAAVVIPTPTPATRRWLESDEANSGTWLRIGESVERRPIEATCLGCGAQRVLFIGGIHGDEPEGLPLIDWLLDELRSQPELLQDVTVLIVRNLNPDGSATGQRTNQHQVDLNRNFPAKNWEAVVKSARFNPGPEPTSEPETQVAVQLIEEFDPQRVLVLHATRGKPMNNYDGPARELAESMRVFNQYAVTDSIGYPTPGSLGSWVGHDLQIPIITLELPRRINPESAWNANKLALLQMLKFAASTE